MAQPRTEPPEPHLSKPGYPAWRQGLLLIVAVLLVGGALLARFLLPLDPQGRALDILEKLGAETNLGSLTATELDLSLETPPDPKPPGHTRKLRDALASGDLVLLHFWASWCPPCLEELPDLTAFAGMMRDRKLTVVAVSYDDAWPEAQAALLKATGDARPAGIQWMRDPAGQDGDPKTMLRLHFGTEQLPETYVLSGGKVLARLIAGQQWTAASMVQAMQLLAPPRPQGVQP